MTPSVCSLIGSQWSPVKRHLFIKPCAMLPSQNHKTCHNYITNIENNHKQSRDMHYSNEINSTIQYLWNLCWCAALITIQLSVSSYDASKMCIVGALHMGPGIWIQCRSQQTALPLHGQAGALIWIWHDC